MISTEPQKRRTLSLCHRIEYSNTTEENKRLVRELIKRWDGRDNTETVTRVT